MTKTKLWHSENQTKIHPLVEKYTNGNDHLLDQKLLGYDIVASKAHAQMLCTINILSEAESAQIEGAFDSLLKLWKEGNFTILPEQEDGHTALEDYLVKQLGSTGKKIHTGRSRNDQSLVMLRLYMKDKLQDIIVKSDSVIASLEKLTVKHGATVMPGYTHMQKAMPTTVGVWLGSYKNAFKDMQKVITSAHDLIDQNPLGSAAGFGVSIELDKKQTTEALGFAKLQENPMYCGLSRGLFEMISVQSLSPTMTLAGKFAQDMLLFTTQEFDFFSLPGSFTTGSSIMPQKKNYDLFEVMRGHAHSFDGYAMKLGAIYSGIGSGYQRDLQLTKPILVEAIESSELTLEMLATAISELIVHEDKLANAITDEMKSVDRINELVVQGVPFRDAYVRIKTELE